MLKKQPLNRYKYDHNVVFSHTKVVNHHRDNGEVSIAMALDHLARVASFDADNAGIGDEADGIDALCYHLCGSTCDKAIAALQSVLRRFEEIRKDQVRTEWVFTDLDVGDKFEFEDKEWTKTTGCSAEDKTGNEARLYWGSVADKKKYASRHNPVVIPLEDKYIPWPASEAHLKKASS